MKVSLFNKFGALNSPPVFDSFKSGAMACGDKVTHHDMNADVAVIWSILFAGRMAQNKEVYEHFDKCLIIEVGQLLRNTTWRLSFDAVNRDGKFANDVTYDSETSRYNRVFKEHVPLHDWKKDGEFVVIATQRQDSHQWSGMPSTEHWLCTQIEKVRDYTDRPIVIRPHPRDKITDYQYIHHKYPGVYFSMPGYYDDKGDIADFPELLKRTHIVINHSSGPGVEALVHGVPVIVSESSFAWDLTTKMEDIEKPNRPDRMNWIEKLSYTEWFESEIAAGIPWQRLKQLV